PLPNGPEQFAKIGPRNAMVIAVCSFAVAMHPDSGTVRAAVGSAWPVPSRSAEAQQFLAGELAAGEGWRLGPELRDTVRRRFGELVGSEATPIDDVRGQADYRKHALTVLARRALGWAWHDYRQGGVHACA